MLPFTSGDESPLSISLLVSSNLQILRLHTTFPSPPFYDTKPTHTTNRAYNRRRKKLQCAQRLGLDADFGDLSRRLGDDGGVKLPPLEETGEMVGGGGEGLRLKESGWDINVGMTKQTITFADCADVLTAIPTNPGKSTAKEGKCAIRARHVAQLIRLKDFGILAPNAHMADMKKWLSEGKDVRNVLTKEAVKQKAGEGWHAKLVVLGDRSKEEGAEK